MTEPDSASSSRSSSHGYPFLIAFLANIVLGYAIYAYARIQGSTMQWVAWLVDDLKPLIKALDSAARVNVQPFPAQVMILYIAVSSAVLAAYFLYCAFFIKTIRKEFGSRLSRQAAQQEGTIGLRLKTGLSGLVLLAVSLIILPLLLFVQDPANPSWRTVVFFSSSFGSTFFLLLIPGVIAWSLTLGLWQIYLSSCKCRFDIRS